MNFLILESENYSEKALNLYSKIGVIFSYDSLVKSDFKKINVLVCRLKYKIDENLISKLPNLQYIISPTTALNHIDLSFAESKNIKVYSLRDLRNEILNITATSELAIGLFFNLVRNIVPASIDVRKNKLWNRDFFKGRQIYGNFNIGIIGFGRIGEQIYRFLKPFNLNFFVNDSNITNQMISHNINNNSIDCLLEYADCIFLCASYDQNDKPILNSDFFKKIKKPIFIINISRGELIDEDALVNAFFENKISGYATDVLVNEFNDGFLNSSKLIALIDSYNILITPHIGGCTVESMANTEYTIAKNFITYVK